MQVDEAKDTFNKFLSNKKLLYDDTNYGRFSNGTFSTVVSFLDKKKYDFKQSEFDNFIINGTYMRGKSYIVKRNYRETKKNSIDIFFTKFTPNDKQIKTLLNCYGKYKSYNHYNYQWIDVLVKKGFKFDTNYKQKLLEIGYNITKLLDTDDINISLFENALLTFNLDDTLFNKVTAILNKLDTEHNPLTSICLHNFICTHINKIGYSKYNNNIFESVMALLLTNNAVIDINIMETILGNIHNCFDVIKIFVPFVKDNNHIFVNLPKDLLSIITLQDKLSCSQSMTILFLMENGFDTNITIINKLLEADNISNDKIFIIFPENIIPEKYRIEINSHVFNLWNYIKTKGIVPNMDTLMIACKKGKPAIFDDIITNYGLYPDKKCLDTALSGLGSTNVNDAMNIINKILDYKIIPDKESYMSLDIRNFPSNDQINNLLIRYGLVVDIDIINKSLEVRCPIYDLYRFGIQYDEKLYFLCHKHMYMPYYNEFNENINKNIFELRNMFKTNSWDNIVKYMKKNNIKPDRYCFENCCLYKNYAVLRKMIELKCVGTRKILYCLIGSEAREIYDSMYGNIIDENDNPEAMAKVYDHIDLDKL